MLTIILAIIGAILILFVLTPAYLFSSTQAKYKSIGVILKGITTGISFLYALFGFLTLSQQSNNLSMKYPILYPYWLLIGLGLCVLADIMLCFRIIAGGALFFLGHLAYIIFFITLGGFHTIAIIIYTLLCVATLCYFYRYTSIVKRFRLFFVLYAMMILITLTLGILLPYTYGIFGIIPAIASVLLVSSDFMLARNKLLLETKTTRFVALSLYFGGQYVMAMTLYIAAFLL